MIKKKKKKKKLQQAEHEGALQTHLVLCLAMRRPACLLQVAEFD